jgi:hypothetical protein
MDHLLEDEVLMPVQYADLLRGDAHRAPEHKLLFAVLEDAVRCWQLYGNAPSRRGQRLFRDVADWFASDDDSSPFTFMAISQLFGLDAAYVRAGLHRWRHRHGATGRPTVVPFRLRRIGGTRHAVCAHAPGLRSPSRRDERRIAATHGRR